MSIISNIQEKIRQKISPALGGLKHHEYRKWGGNEEKDDIEKR